MSGIIKDTYDLSCISTDDKKGIKLNVDYSGYLHKFRVRVSYGESKREGTFVASFEPRFGMDVVDHQQAMELADKYAIEIEKECGI